MADGLSHQLRHSSAHTPMRLIYTNLAGQTFLLCLAGRCAPSGHIEGMYSSVLSVKRVLFD